MNNYADILFDYFKSKLSKIPDFDVTDVLEYHSSVNNKFYSLRIRIEGGEPFVVSTTPVYGANNDNLITFIEDCCQDYAISDCEIFACLKDRYRGFHNKPYPLFFRYDSGNVNCLPYPDNFVTRKVGFLEKPELSFLERNRLVFFRGASSGRRRKRWRKPLLKSPEYMRVCKTDFGRTSGKGNPLSKKRVGKNFVGFEGQQQYSFVVSAPGNGPWRNSDLVVLGVGAVPVFITHANTYGSFLSPLLVNGETHVEILWDKDPRIIAARFDELYQDYLDHPTKYQAIAERARTIYEFFESNSQSALHSIYAKLLNNYAEKYF